MRGATLIGFPHALRQLPRDGWLLFATRFVRLFAYGSLSVVLVFYLVGIGLSEVKTGLLLTLTLVGDVGVSLVLTTRADRAGRRRTLLLGALLMAGAGLVFASTHNFWLLVAAGVVGVISPSGHEVGPFLSVEQAALTHVVDAQVRTHVFAWYAVVGSLATALGALAAGAGTQLLQRSRVAPVDSYRVVVSWYAVLGLVLLGMFLAVSSKTEALPTDPLILPNRLAGLTGLNRSRHTVARLSALFALDSFGGGFVVQSLAAYWFHLRFGVDPAALGGIFFWANIVAGISALVAARLAERIGLIKTMVFTHLPSNVLLILIPLMPTLPLAVFVLLLRFSISQMDVPARQSYVMAVVPAEERSAAAGVTGVARTIGAAISPLLAGVMFARPASINLPFFVAGSIKIAYDVVLYLAFVGTERSKFDAGRFTST